MAPLRRRSFLKGAGTALACRMLGGATLRGGDPATSAELLLKNGAIATMDDKRPWAEAMTVRSGRILAVGANQEMERFVSSETKTIDLGGKCVSPGIIDAHSHVIGFGHMQLKYVLLRPPKVDSFDTLRNELAKAAKKKPAGQWIVGRGFDTFREGRFPRREELDVAVPNHPLLIIHWGGQFGVANTLALQKADLLRADAKDPYGGLYLRDRRSGLPNGVLIHYPAIYSVYEPTLTSEEQIECAAWAVQRFGAQGVTCIHDNFCVPRHAGTYVRLEQTGKLPCRLRVYPYVSNLQHCETLLTNMRRYQGPLCRFQGVKLAVDGYALMYEVPEERRQMAIPMHPQPQLEAIVAAIHRADLQVDVHAVGDKGVDWTLAAFVKAAGSVAECRRRRHRIEHFPFRKLDSVRRAAELGVPVCVQPNYIELKADDFRRQMGQGIARYVDTMVPLRTYMKEGVRVAYGADVPAFPSHSPLDSIRSAMERKTAGGTRLNSSEAVSFLEALRHHTIGSAYAAFDEAELGSLEPGKLADFVIWNGDLRKVRSGRDAASLRPLATYLAGKAVFQAARAT